MGLPSINCQALISVKVSLEGANINCMDVLKLQQLNYTIKIYVIKNMSLLIKGFLLCFILCLFDYFFLFCFVWHEGLR